MQQYTTFDLKRLYNDNTYDREGNYCHIPIESSTRTTFDLELTPKDFGSVPGSYEYDDDVHPHIPNIPTADVVVKVAKHLAITLGNQLNRMRYRNFSGNYIYALATKNNFYNDHYVWLYTTAIDDLLLNLDHGIVRDIHTDCVVAAKKAIWYYQAYLIVHTPTMFRYLAPDEAMNAFDEAKKYAKIRMDLYYKRGMLLTGEYRNEAGVAYEVVYTNPSVPVSENHAYIYQCYYEDMFLETPPNKKLFQHTIDTTEDQIKKHIDLTRKYREDYDHYDALNIELGDNQIYDQYPKVYRNAKLYLSCCEKLEKLQRRQQHNIGVLDMANVNVKYINPETATQNVSYPTNLEMAANRAAANPDYGTQPKQKFTHWEELPPLNIRVDPAYAIPERDDPPIPPGMQPNQPAPNQPMQPNQPTSHPNMKPNQPGMHPNQPMPQPNQPAPNQPGMQPNQPMPQQPQWNDPRMPQPNQPGMQPNQPTPQPQWNDPRMPQPNQPGMQPNQPMPQPQWGGDPRMQPNQPGYQPMPQPQWGGDPRMQPNQPGMQPMPQPQWGGDPRMQPNQPGMQPGMQPNQPMLQPQWNDPRMQPNQPGMQPGMQPNQPMPQPQWGGDPRMQPNQPGYQPMPQQQWGGDPRMQPGMQPGYQQQAGVNPNGNINPFNTPSGNMNSVIVPTKEARNKRYSNRTATPPTQPVNNMQQPLKSQADIQASINARTEYHKDINREYNKLTNNPNGPIDVPVHNMPLRDNRNGIDLTISTSDPDFYMPDGESNIDVLAENWKGLNDATLSKVVRFVVTNKVKDTGLPQYIINKFHPDERIRDQCAQYGQDTPDYLSADEIKAINKRDAELKEQRIVGVPTPERGTVTAAQTTEPMFEDISAERLISMGYDREDLMDTNDDKDNGVPVPDVSRIEYPKHNKVWDKLMDREEHKVTTLGGSIVTNSKAVIGDARKDIDLLKAAAANKDVSKETKVTETVMAKTSLRSAIASAEVTRINDSNAVSHTNLAVINEPIITGHNVSDVMAKIKEGKNFNGLGLILQEVVNKDPDDPRLESIKKLALTVNSRLTVMVNDFVKKNLKVKLSIDDFCEDATELYYFLKNEYGSVASDAYKAFEREVIKGIQTELSESDIKELTSTLVITPGCRVSFLPMAVSITTSRLYLHQLNICIKDSEFIVTPANDPMLFDMLEAGAIKAFDNKFPAPVSYFVTGDGLKYKVFESYFNVDEYVLQRVVV